MSDINWESAPEGATHYDTREGVYPWLKEDDNGNKYWHFNCWVNYANDIGVNDSIFAMPSKKVYTAAMCEAGTPPIVGMMVLCSFEDGKWEKVLIDFISEILVVVTDQHSAQYSFPIKEAQFKPVDNRTNEEKAADDFIENRQYTATGDELVRAIFLAGTTWSKS